MEFEILTMDGNYIRIKEVVGVCTPNKDNPHVFRFTTKKNNIIFLQRILNIVKKYFKMITLIIGKEK